VLVVLAADAPPPQRPRSLGAVPVFGIVWTKCDLGAPGVVPAAVAAAAAGAPVFATSARSGLGLRELAAHLGTLARGSVVDAGGPLRAALHTAHDAVARALALADGPEVVAVELQAALRALGGIGGAHSPEQLLDRIYARFCLGK